MTMWKIVLDSENHEMCEKSIMLKTIFGNVFAPKSKCVLNGDVLSVPEWVFVKSGFNPCQIVTGFNGKEV